MLLSRNSGTKLVILFGMDNYSTDYLIDECLFDDFTCFNLLI